MLRDVGVGAREQEAPVGDVGVAGPDLVAVDHVLVAVARRGGAQRREVGSGVGLAEALAPALAPADQAGQEALLDRLAAVRRDPLHEVAEARARRRAGGGELLVEDDVEDRGQVVTAEAGGPARARRSRRRRARCATPPAAPSTRRRSTRPADPGCSRRARRAGAPGTPLPPASHESPSAHPQTRPLAAGAAARRRRRTTGRRAAHGAGRRGRCSPTCSPSRRAPAPRSRRPCARRARSRPWPRARRRGPRRARAGRRPTTAYSATLNAPSIRQRASARRCCTAWNVPIGDAVLPALLRVGDRDVEHAAHEPDQIGARERQAQGRPRVEIVAREEPGLVGNREQRARRPGVARIVRVRSAPSLAPSTCTSARR